MGLSPGLGEGSLKLTSSRLRFLLRLRSVDPLMRNPLPQHNEGVTDLFVGAPNGDVALIARTFDQGVGRDPGARNVVDLSRRPVCISDVSR